MKRETESLLCAAQDQALHTNAMKSKIYKRHDIVVIDKAKKTCQIVDIAVPSDQNIAKREKEKIDKYHELKLEIMRMWSVKAWVVPIVVGALGCTTKKLEG